MLSKTRRHERLLKSSWTNLSFWHGREDSYRQGWNFESSLFQEVCRLLGIEKTYTSAYHGDGMIKRFNRTLEAMLSKYVEKHQRDWAIHLPKVMMAYCSSVEESTGYSPYHLMFGREICLSVDVMSGNTPDQPVGKYEYVEGLRESLESA